MASDVMMKAGRLFSNELRKLAKAANQRMVELEKRGYNSPAYQAAQGRLASLGAKGGRAAGFRFNESGYFRNKNEMAQYEAALKRFMSQETSKLRGYKVYRKKVLEGLQERYDYKSAGMTDDDMMAFWENMPDDERDRMFGSDEAVIITMKYFKDRKSGKISNENMLSMSEIVDRINSSKSVTEALEKLGINQDEYLKFKQESSSGLGKL